MRPSWFQILTLHAVDKGNVTWDGEQWQSAWGGRVTGQINRLAELGLVDDTAEPIAVTVAGLGVLSEHSETEVLMKLNGR